MRWGSQKLQCCPECGSANAAIIDTRYIEETGWKRRRRKCHACQHRWSTVELPAELVGELETVYVQLKRIEQLAAESRLTLVGGNLSLSWDKSEETDLVAPDGPVRTTR